MNCDELSCIPDWIIDHPESASVFDEFGLDTSCGCKSLEFVCRQQDIHPATVLGSLRRKIVLSQPNTYQQ